MGSGGGVGVSRLKEEVCFCLGICKVCAKLGTVIDHSYYVLSGVFCEVI